MEGFTGTRGPPSSPSRSNVGLAPSPSPSPSPSPFRKLAKPVAHDGSSTALVHKPLVRVSHLTNDILMSLVQDGRPLCSVTQITLALDTREESAALLGEVMPQLTQLCINDSLLSSFRDLGTSLRRLTTLHAARCGLTDLDGISALPALTHLYAPDNNISDLTPLAMHDSLGTLDISGNPLADAAALFPLATCSELTTVYLRNTPAAGSWAEHADMLPLHVRVITQDRHEPGTPSITPLGSRSTVLGSAPLLAKPLSRSASVGSAHDADELCAPATALRASLEDSSFSLTASFSGASSTSAGTALSLVASSDLTYGDSAILFAGTPIMSMRKRRVSTSRQAGRGLADTLGGPILTTSASSTHEAATSCAASLGSMSPHRPIMPQRVGAKVVAPASSDATAGNAVHVPARPHPSAAVAAVRASLSGLSAPVTPSASDADTPLSIMDVLNAGREEDAAVKKERTRPVSAMTRPSSSSSARAAAAPVPRGDASVRGDEVGSSLVSTRISAGSEGTTVHTHARTSTAPGIVMGMTQPRTVSDALPDEGAADLLSSMLDDGALALDDDALVHLLQQKPKNVPVLHSREAFRRFFKGVSESRMRSLLQQAFEGAPDADDRVAKRMQLLHGVLLAY